MKFRMLDKDTGIDNVSRDTCSCGGGVRVFGRRMVGIQCTRRDAVKSPSLYVLLHRGSADCIGRFGVGGEATKRLHPVELVVVNGKQLVLFDKGNGRVI